MVRVVFSYGPSSPRLWSELSGYPIETAGWKGTSVCDVDSYPTTFPEDTRWKVAVGIHPRNNPFVTEEFTAL
jgi:hypothetical protein